jgi:hypothetical protein
MALYLRSVIRAFAGRSTEAVARAERAVRLSPFDLLTHEANHTQSMAAFQDARYNDARIAPGTALRTRR